MWTLYMMQTIHIKSQILISLKNKKNQYQNICLAVIFKIGTSLVKVCIFISLYSVFNTDFTTQGVRWGNFLYMA